MKKSNYRKNLSALAALGSIFIGAAMMPVLSLANIDRATFSCTISELKEHDFGGVDPVITPVPGTITVNGGYDPFALRFLGANQEDPNSGLEILFNGTPAEIAAGTNRVPTHFFVSPAPYPDADRDRIFLRILNDGLEWGLHVEFVAAGSNANAAQIMLVPEGDQGVRILRSNNIDCTSVRP